MWAPQSASLAHAAGTHELYSAGSQVLHSCPAAQAIIEGLQPHHRQYGFFVTHPLWLLHGLSNVDKHRALHVALLAQTQAGIARVVGRIRPFASAR